MTRQSRLATIEQKKAKKSIFIYVGLTIILVILIFFRGFDLLANFASTVSNLAKSEKPIQSDDKTPPAPPQISRLPEYTKESEIEVKGFSETGAIVSIIYNSELKETIVSDTGAFSVIIPLDEGSNKIVAEAKDTFGNTSSQSKTYFVTQDKKSPEMEIQKPKDGDSIFGKSNQNLTIEGTTNEECLVKINDRIAIIKSDNKFQGTLSLSEGSNSIKIIATDKAGNTTEKTITVNFSL